MSRVAEFVSRVAEFVSRVAELPNCRGRFKEINLSNRRFKVKKLRKYLN